MELVNNAKLLVKSKPKSGKNTDVTVALAAVAVGEQKFSPRMKAVSKIIIKDSYTAMIILMSHSYIR